VREKTEKPKAKSHLSNLSAIIFMVLLALSFFLLAIGIILPSPKILGVSTLIFGILFAFEFGTSSPRSRYPRNPEEMSTDYWGIIGIVLAIIMIVLGLLIILGYIG